MEVKKNKKKSVWKRILFFLLFLIAAAATVVFLFRTRAINVEGNDYYGDNTVRTWIEEDDLAVNTLYILYKYNYTDAALPSAVESMKISLDNPWTVHVKVKEKKMAGYVEYDDAYLYFDREGIASLRTKKQLEGVPMIENLVFDSFKVDLGSMLPVEDETVFSRVIDVSKNLDKYEVVPDRVTCSAGSVNLYFGEVEVLLGTGNYEDRVAQVGPIIAKLKELYPDKTGTLHLENYDVSSESVRFVPSN